MESLKRTQVLAINTHWSGFEVALESGQGGCAPGSRPSTACPVTRAGGTVLSWAVGSLFRRW